MNKIDAKRRAAARKARVTRLAKDLCSRFGEHQWDAIPGGDPESQAWWRAHAAEILGRAR